MLGGQVCSSSCSRPAKITCPLIAFVPAGFESADSNHGDLCSPFSSPFWTIGQLSRLSRTTLEKSYDKGFRQIRGTGWKGHGLGVSDNRSREPLGVILRPGILVLRRELLLNGSPRCHHPSPATSRTPRTHVPGKVGRKGRIRGKSIL
jgi:hypothetical protein